MEENSVTCLIPTFNGIDLIKSCLPSLVEATRDNGLTIEWLVVDDGSCDHTSQWINRAYPQVKVIRNNENLGFIRSVNHGVNKASHEIVFLLNSDISAQEDFMNPALENFKDPGIFSVTFKSLFPRTLEFREGAKGAVFKAGFIKLRHSERHQPRRQSYGIPSLYAVGGHFAVRRSMFIELGGFDELFHPFYWEDVDLSYRAWKRGWKVVYNPACRVIHNEIGTIKSIYREKQIRRIRYANRLLFLWKNLDDKLFIVMQFLFFVLRILFSWLILDFEYYKYAFPVLKKTGFVITARKIRIKRGDVHSDKAILKQF
ncbi:MAG: glycosyltransferase family 2 protein [bacterium]